MSDEVEIKLPKLGESIVSATIVQWFKKVGDSVKLDEPLLEVSTDKVNSEIPSPVSGKVSKILADPEQELDVGAPLAMIITKEGSVSEEAIATPSESLTQSKDTPSKKGFFTPVVLKIAQEKGIDLSELENIPATGAGGRLSKRDLENYLQNRTAVPAIPAIGGEERVKMSTMRKMIADAMVRSFYEAPHATLVNEVDVTKLIKYLKENKEPFRKENGYKLTITSYIAKAIGEGVKKFPMINASLEGDTIVIKKNVNLGIAVSVEQGILVPVIADCHTRPVKEIAQEVSALSDKARKGNLKPDQVKEGTFTMTNFGMSGVLIGTPIIRQPEVAILGVGAINKKVIALEDDSVAIRSMMNLSLSIDHRVIDGMYGCGFLAEVKHYLENFQ
ncbi:dihydrolipoamide acetyltransferase family protein [Candidatus Neptunichlamydia sp. REUL1]|uniref:dihydrolipoamide acetyltransferase family protein n=1 Tax=Candidatus Neptunichlamydia sp. REUL1 TaxID=3064277 RepID=UPI002931F37F|nr:dihydrolipoamide acetyltransferase family protein [Candidatus Neptunochlamydia sp. REUL1]